MAQLFGEHRQHLRLRRCSQPISIQKNCFAADGIGPLAALDLYGGEQRDRRQLAEISRRPLRNQPPERSWLPWQQQRLLGRCCEASMHCPLLQQPMPFRPQRSKASTGSRQRAAGSSEAGAGEVMAIANHAGFLPIVEQRNLIYDSSSASGSVLKAYA